MDDTIDLLQIKIEKAKRELSDDTQNAIATVQWQATILKMRETKGYSFEQLGDLETETELLLCGLLSSEDYPKELENRMKISKAQANELVNYMNQEVFSKIKEELVKIIERKKIFTNVNQVPKATSTPEVKKELKINIQKPNTSGIKTINKIDLTIPELPAGEKSAPQSVASEQKKVEVNPILAQKLSGPVQIPSIKTEHTIENITKTNTPNLPNQKVNTPATDPYREIPE